jgi:hypothetical protein
MPLNLCPLFTSTGAQRVSQKLNDFKRYSHGQRRIP